MVGAGRVAGGVGLGERGGNEHDTIPLFPSLLSFCLCLDVN